MGNLYRKVIAASDEELHFKSQENKYPQSWLNDGTILFMNQQSALYRLPASGDGEPELLRQIASQTDEFRLSPDERWIAYNSVESGRWEVYVASFPSFGGKRRVSSGGGCQAHWRKDGKELFYLDLKGQLMALDVAMGVGAAPRPLFQTPIPVNPLIDQYDGDRGRPPVYPRHAARRRRAAHGDAQLDRGPEAVDQHIHLHPSF